MLREHKKGRCQTGSDIRSVVPESPARYSDDTAPRKIRRHHDSSVLLSASSLLMMLAVMLILINDLDDFTALALQ